MRSLISLERSRQRRTNRPHRPLSAVSVVKAKACINTVMHAFVDFLKPYDGGGSTRLIPICSTRLSLWKNAQSTFGLSG